MDIGVGLGSILWGFISNTLGFIYVYLGSAVSAILSLIIYMLLVRKQLSVSNYMQ